MDALATQLSTQLQPIADWFAGFGTPAAIVRWGHPAMMGIVVLVLGSYTAWAGWQGRTTQDLAVKEKAWADHKKLAPLMTLFITLGYTGGILSLVMQGHPILGSAHFWTGSAAIAVLGVNGLISATKFGGGQPALRTAHALIGTAAMGLLLVHGAFGLQLGLSL